LSEKATCRDCKHAVWQRTPTGRIKRFTAGHCAKDRELLQVYAVQNPAPCIVLGRTHVTSVWPDYDASGCPMREQIKEPK